jgi:RNA polymerase sigma-70 factor (ECF subfamily)
MAAVSVELVWLLAAVAFGDTDAFERLYDATRAKIYGVLIRILRRKDLAEEVMQQSYVEIWRLAGGFDPRTANPMVWMVGLARAEAFAVLRTRSARGMTDEPRTGDIEGSGHPVPTHEMTEALRLLLARMGRLDEEHRRVLLLAYYNGWSREQLAAKFDASPDVIKARLREALLQIRGAAL